MKCLNCGIEDAGVKFHYEYVGGKGYGETGPYCTDQVACWARYDEQHGFKNTPAIMEMQSREIEVVPA